MTFSSTSKSFKAVIVLVVVVVVFWVVVVFFLVESARDIMVLGQVIQTEISELGMQIPKLPQTLNRHNQTKLPRIINNRMERKIGILQFPVKDIIEILQKNVKVILYKNFTSCSTKHRMK